MTTTPDLSDQTEDAERQTLTALFGQLVDDSRSFARAEMAYLRAQAGERASYALPGVVMICAAAALSFGAIVALLIALMLWLSTVMALGWATLIVTLAAGLTCVILVRVGLSRLRGSLKSRDDR